MWHFLFVNFISQCCIHSAIPTSARFLFRNLFMETLSVVGERMRRDEEEEEEEKAMMKEAKKRRRRMMTSLL